jgi:nitroimidazol reductase NimA-like FMN-containing flavoprotein (pyridoxamine 5'-phosphate oxidase superfamily)
MKRSPDFLILTADDCRDMLRRNRVGRLAFLNDGRVDIQPIGYVARGMWIYLRSAWGEKMEALAHNPYAAFEVDEAAGPFDWRSVVAQGTVYHLYDDGTSAERELYKAAVDALRSAMPETLTDKDPTPRRTMVYGLHIDNLVGRMARRSSRSDGNSRATAPEKSRPRGSRPPGVR